MPCIASWSKIARNSNCAFVALFSIVKCPAPLVGTKYPATRVASAHSITFKGVRDFDGKAALVRCHINFSLVNVLLNPENRKDQTIAFDNKITLSLAR